MTTQSIKSIGHVASQLQRSVGTIYKAASYLGILPSVKIDDVVYFDECDVEAFAEYFHKDGREDE